MKANSIKNGAFDYYTRLRRLKFYVDEHYTERIPLEKAADIAAMEMTYFSTFFHKKVGIPFTDWLRHLRILKAIELMKKEDQTICHIAFAVGFGDLRSFERAFKKYTGLTPREFRKSLENSAPAEQTQPGSK